MTKAKGRKQSRQKRNWWKVALPILAVPVALTAGILLHREYSQRAEQQRVDRVLTVAKQKIGQCYDMIATVTNTDSTTGCSDIYSSMLSGISEIAPELRLNPMDEGGSVQKLEHYLFPRGIALVSDVRRLGGREFREFRINRIKDVEDDAIGGASIKIVTVSEPVISDFFEERPPQGFDPLVATAYTHGDKLYIRDEGYGKEARSLWDFYKKIEGVGFDNWLQITKSDLESLYRSGEGRRFRSALAGVLDRLEWRDLYKSAGNEGDFVEQYKESAWAIAVAHEKDHLKERLIEKQPYKGWESERRAILEEVMALPEYKPQFRIDGYRTFARIVRNIDAPSENYNLASRSIASCFVDQMKNKRIPGADYKGLSGDTPADLYLLKLLGMTMNQLFTVANNCVIIGKN